MTSAALNLVATISPLMTEIPQGHRPPMVTGVSAYAQRFQIEERSNDLPYPNALTSSRMQPVTGFPSLFPPPATAASVVPIHGFKDQTKARLRMLRRLPGNHDGEGAAAANTASVDEAIAFLDAMQCSTPYFATLSDDGCAVIEFEVRSTGFFADITFRPNGVVECYWRMGGAVSELVEGRLDDSGIRSFLASKIGVTV